MNSSQSLFEEKIFFQYWLNSIRKNDNPPTPKISGCMDFVPGKIENRDVFLRKDADGNYIRNDVSAMWFGWQLAFSENKTIEQIIQARKELQLAKNEYQKALEQYKEGSQYQEILNTYEAKFMAFYKTMNLAHGLESIVDKVIEKPNEI